MNKANINKPVPVINIREIIWGLLQQWKAVLLAALVIMILVCGLKYAKDMGSFNEAQSNKDVEEKTIEQRIDDVLTALPESERSAVEYIVRQNDWVDSERDYFNKSILMNTDAANQRTLILDYYIKTADTSDSIITSLVYGYAGFVNNDAVTTGLKEAIAPGAEDKYIAELITVNNGNGSNNNTDRMQMTVVDEDAAVLEVRIVLPEEADAEKAEAAVTEAFSNYSPELGNKIGKHSISLIKSGVTYLYNSSLINNRNNMMYSIYTLQNNARNMQTSLSDAQKAALESITALKKETANVASYAEAASGETQTASEDLQKPGLSKKYAMLGFLLGAFAYACAYLLLVMKKGCIGSASETEYYTRSRVLGEVYGTTGNKGLKKLLTSRFVEGLHYKGKTDVNAQEEKTADAIAAVCEHIKIKDLKVLNMTGETNDCTEAVIKAIENKGIGTVVVEAEDFSEKDLLNTESAILIAGPHTKAGDISEVASLCADYDVKMLGSVYIDSAALS